MVRPELLVSAGSKEEIKVLLSAGADAVVVGEPAFGLRLPGTITTEDLAEIIPWAHEHGKKIYVSVNTVIENHKIASLSTYLKKLNDLQVDAVIFGDPAVIMAAKEAAPGLKLHWNSEMTTTNYVTAAYWGDKGASRAVLARELNMDEVLEFKQNSELEVEVQVHGLTNIYHSKRDLVDSYMGHRNVQQGAVNASMDRGLFLIEHERPNERFPIYQDENGTQIMSSDDVCMIENLPELLDGNIDSLKIEGLLKSVKYNETVVRNYRAAIDSYLADPANYKFKDEWLEEIQELQDPDRELTFGFFYKEQVY
ncbi:U32 family peptidase [Paenibacillus albiflavus]|uniref:U32 family peptidase n=1 Tax=Paenibacillus albiflavus TaxID=2545760 RepID=A0A4R4EBF2_9BACL|nr:peptidase U32 family protein [Paenibacillus albiflavus]TCZ77206.1 U32 family peptidase [Paenibacillus albiflavus]